MIWLTGDLHDMGLKSGNQEHCLKRFGLTEIQIAHKYTELLDEAGVKATFFVTGRAFKDEWDDLKPIAENPLIEIGGHTWNCYLSPWCEWTGIRLLPSLWARAWNKIGNSYNGPYSYHKKDTQKTIDIIQEKTGEKITAWRHHMYMHGMHTEAVIKECGIKIISDGVKKGVTKPNEENGLWSMPINIIPDHEHLYHAERTKEWVEKWQKRYNWSDDFGSQSYEIEEWTDIVIDGLKENLQKGAVSCMLIHPVTMYLCDEFESFKRILSLIKEYPTAHSGELFNA